MRAVSELSFFLNSILSWLISVPAILFRMRPRGNTDFSEMSVSVSQILNIAPRIWVVMTKWGKVA